MYKIDLQGNEPQLVNAGLDSLIAQWKDLISIATGVKEKAGQGSELTVTHAEVNIIGAALGEHPLKFTKDAFDRLQLQCKDQNGKVEEQKLQEVGHEAVVETGD